MEKTWICVAFGGLKVAEIFENHIYEIIINSSFMTCVRVDLSKKQKPYPLSK